MAPFAERLDDLGGEPGDADQPGGAGAALAKLGCNRADRKGRRCQHRISNDVRLDDKADQRLVAIRCGTSVGGEHQLHILAVADADRRCGEDDLLLVAVNWEVEDATERRTVDGDDDLLLINL